MKPVSVAISVEENRVFDEALGDEEMESYPLAEIEAIIENGDFTDDQAKAMLWEFNLQRTAKSLLQVSHPDLGRPAQLLGKGHFGFTGFVRDDQFHVFDSFGTGLSHRDMLDEGPQYRPICLKFIASKGDSIRYLD